MPLSPASIRVEGVVSDHLKILVWDMLRDGGDEFLGGEHLEVFLVVPIGHGGAIEDLAGIFAIGDLLFGEGVSHDIFRKRLLPIPVVRGYAVSGVHTESTVMPGHEFFNELVVYLALAL